MDAEKARERLPDNSYPAKMYDFIKKSYETNSDKGDWEFTRDAVLYSLSAGSVGMAINTVQPLMPDKFCR